MAVERIISDALGKRRDADAQETRAWMKRNEAFLEWVARHPKLVEINAEAAHLLTRYHAAKPG
jgi:hypothetical protein